MQAAMKERIHTPANSLCMLSNLCAYKKCAWPEQWYMNKEHTYLNRLTAGVAVARSHSMSARRAASAPSNPASAASDPAREPKRMSANPLPPCKDRPHMPGSPVKRLEACNAQTAWLS